MSNSKTIAQRMEEARIQAGAQNYKGHGYMDLARFDENTRHMVIFHVLTHDSPVGDKGDRMRLFLSNKGYQKALEHERHGNIQILSHARVLRGNLIYDHKDQLRSRRFYESEYSAAPAGSSALAGIAFSLQIP